MGLEDSFQDARLTKVQFKRAARGLKRSYSKLEERDYTYQDVQALFDGVDIDEKQKGELINRQLQRIKPRGVREIPKEKKKKNYSNYVGEIKVPKRKTRKKRIFTNETLMSILGCVLGWGVFLYAVAGERMRYDYQYLNALSNYTFTEQESELRKDIFLFFDKKDEDNSLARKIAATNRYFIIVKETDLTRSEAISVLENTRDDVLGNSLRRISRLASRHAKELQENKTRIEKSGLSVEEVIDVIGIPWHPNYSVDSVLDYFSELKKKGISYQEGVGLIKKYDLYGRESLKGIINTIDKLKKENLE